MSNKMAKIGCFVILVFTSVAVSADNDSNRFLNSDNCVSTKWTDEFGNSISIDEKFGAGSMDVTRCLSNTKKAKVIYQINTECKNSACASPYAVGNIKNQIVDYTVTHGMEPDDYKIVVVVHSAGWKLVLNNSADKKHSVDNPFQAEMEALLNEPSVKVLFCQNTASSKGVVKANMIPGIGFVTAGVSALSDLQDRGYRYVQP